MLKRARCLSSTSGITQQHFVVVLQFINQDHVFLRTPALAAALDTAGSPGTGGKLLEGRDAFIPPDHSSLEPRVLATESPSPRYYCCSCNVTANYKESGMRSEIADNSRDDL